MCSQNKENKMEQFLPYAGIILPVVMFLLTYKIFTTPEQLEKKHREILDDAEKKFASLQVVNDLKSQFSKIEEKIDEIYNILIKKQ